MAMLVPHFVSPMLGLTAHKEWHNDTHAALYIRIDVMSNLNVKCLEKNIFTSDEWKYMTKISQTVVYLCNTDLKY